MEGRIRVGMPGNCEQLSRSLESLWPESSAEEHRSELSCILAGKPRATMPLVIFVAEAADGMIAGFIEVGLRSHADGCDTNSTVGFVEGWFVVEQYRQSGWCAIARCGGELGPWSRLHRDGVGHWG